MKYGFTAARSLAAGLAAEGLFADWCAGRGSDVLGPGAAAELESALADPDTDPAPLFAGGWSPDDPPGPVAAANLEALRRGEARVVVTGQQPGFMGGPLLTLYKIATAVGLARRRTAAGRPTVPVFWCGDDDEDLAEALEPVGWRIEAGTLLRAPAELRRDARRGTRRIIGRSLAASVAGEAGAWLARRAAAGDELTVALSALWAEAAKGGHSWGRLSARAVARIFAADGLLVVRGDDARLHTAASDLYGDMAARRAELADLARRRGRELAAAGWHAQLGDVSLARPLYEVHEDARRVLAPDASTIDAATLRPGVLLRSPVQDWLLRPAAVVAGPAEAAYLRQLDPLYPALGVRRAPVVPRLFAWLRPPALPVNAIEDHAGARPVPRHETDRLAGALADDLAAALGAVLTERLGTSPERARQLSAGRARRWRRGASALLRSEARAQASARRPSEPGWVFPDGQRQERRLAVAAAVGLWGGALVDSVVDAAADHLERGLQGDWAEYEIEVPPPAAPERRTDDQP